MIGVSTKTLWNEYGIAGYRLWGSIQPIWNTYFYLQEALKYQTPKVVLFDIHSLSFQQDYADYAVQVKNTIGLNYSPLRLEAVKTSAPEEKWADLFLGFPTYHSRYSELQEEDFSYFPCMTISFARRARSRRRISKVKSFHVHFSPTFGI